MLCSQVSQGNTGLQDLVFQALRVLWEKHLRSPTFHKMLHLRWLTVQMCPAHSDGEGAHYA